MDISSKGTFEIPTLHILLCNNLICNKIVIKVKLVGPFWETWQHFVTQVCKS